MVILGGGHWSFIVAVNGEGKRAWFVARWCCNFYKGVVLVYEMLQRWGLSLVKSEVQHL